VLAADFIFDDDLEAAEEQLKAGSSCFHTVRFAAYQAMFMVT
jgi:hypothetical protein